MEETDFVLYAGNWTSTNFSSTSSTTFIFYDRVKNSSTKFSFSLLWFSDRIKMALEFPLYHVVHCFIGVPKVKGSHFIGNGHVLEKVRPSFYFQSIKCQQDSFIHVLLQLLIIVFYTLLIPIAKCSVSEKILHRFKIDFPQENCPAVDVCSCEILQTD